MAQSGPSFNITILSELVEKLDKVYASLVKVEEKLSRFDTFSFNLSITEKSAVTLNTLTMALGRLQKLDSAAIGLIAKNMELVIKAFDNIKDIDPSKILKLPATFTEFSKGLNALASAAIKLSASQTQLAQGLASVKTFMDQLDTIKVPDLSDAVFKDISEVGKRLSSFALSFTRLSKLSSNDFTNTLTNLSALLKGLDKLGKEENIESKFTVFKKILSNLLGLFTKIVIPDNVKPGQITSTIKEAFSALSSVTGLLTTLAKRPLDNSVAENMTRVTSLVPKLINDLLNIRITTTGSKTKSDLFRQVLPVIKGFTLLLKELGDTTLVGGVLSRPIDWVKLQTIMAPLKTFIRSLFNLMNSFTNIKSGTDGLKSFKAMGHLLAGMGLLFSSIQNFQQFSDNNSAITSFIKNFFVFGQLAGVIKRTISSFKGIDASRLSGIGSILQGLGKFLKEVSPVLESVSGMGIFQAKVITSKLNGIAGIFSGSLTKLIKAASEVRGDGIKYLAEVIGNLQALERSLKNTSGDSAKGAPDLSYLKALSKIVSSIIVPLIKSLKKFKDYNPAVIADIISAIKGIDQIGDKLSSSTTGRINTKSLTEMILFITKTLIPNLSKLSSKKAGSFNSAILESVKSLLSIVSSVKFSGAVNVNQLSFLPQIADSLVSFYTKISRVKDIKLPDIKGLVPSIDTLLSSTSGASSQVAKKFDDMSQSVRRGANESARDIAILKAGASAAKIALSSLGTALGAVIGMPALRTGYTYMANFSRGLMEIGQSAVTSGLSLVSIASSIKSFVSTVTNSQAMNIAKDFEKVNTSLRVFGGLTEEEGKRAENFALMIGEAYPLTATQASQAIEELVKSGRSLSEAEFIMPSAADLAALSGRTLPEVTSTLIAVTSGFQNFTNTVKSGYENISVAANIIGAAADASTASVSSLSDGLANVGPSANSAGLSLQETTAILAIFDQNAIKGAEGGTALRSFLNALGSEKTINTLQTLETTVKGLGGEFRDLSLSLYNPDGSKRNMNDFLNELATALDAVAGAKGLEARDRFLQDLADTYGRQGLNVLLNAGTDSIDRMIDKMNQSSPISERAALMTQNYAGSIEILKSSLESLYIRVLTPMIQNTLKPMVDNLAAVVKGLSNMNPFLIESIGRFLGFSLSVSLLSSTLLLSYGSILKFGGVFIQFIGFIANPVRVAVEVIRLFTSSFIGLAASLAAFTGAAAVVGSMFAVFTTLNAVMDNNYGGAFDALTNLKATIQDFFNVVLSTGKEAADLLSHIFGGGGEHSVLNVAGLGIKVFIDSINNSLKTGVIGKFVEELRNLGGVIKFVNDTITFKDDMASAVDKVEKRFNLGVGTVLSEEDLEAFKSSTEKSFNEAYQIAADVVIKMNPLFTALFGEFAESADFTKFVETTILKASTAVTTSLVSLRFSMQDAFSKGDILGVLDALNNQGGDVIATIVKTLDDLFVTDLSAWVKSFSENGIIATLGTAIKGVFKSFGDIVKLNLEPIRGILYNVLTAPLDIISAIASIPELGMLGDIFQDVIDTLKMFVDGFVNTFLGVVTGKNLFDAAVEGFKTSVPALSALLLSLQSVFKKVVDLVQIFNNVMKTEFLESGNVVADVANVALSMLNTSLMALDSLLLTPFFEFDIPTKFAQLLSTISRVITIPLLEDGVGGMIQSILDFLGQTLVSLIDSVFSFDFIAKVTDGLKAASSGWFDLVKSIFGDNLGILEYSFGISEAIQSAFISVFTFILNTVTSIKNAFVSLFSTGGSMNEELEAATGESISDAVSLVSVVQKEGAKVLKVLKTIMSAIVNGFKAFSSGLNTVLNFLLTDIIQPLLRLDFQQVFSVIGKGLSKVLSFKWLTDIFSFVSDFEADTKILSSIGTFISNAINSYAKFIVKLFSVENVTKVFDAVKSAIAGAVSSLSSALSSIFNTNIDLSFVTDAAGFILGAVEGFLAFSIRVRDKLIEFVSSGGLTGIFNAVSEAFQGVLRAAESLFDNILVPLSALDIAGLVEGVFSVFRELLSIDVSNVVDTVLDAIHGLSITIYEALTGSVSDVGSSVIDSVFSALRDVLSFVANSIDSVADLIKSIISSDTIKNVIAGVKNVFEKVVDLAQGLSVVISNILNSDLIRDAKETVDNAIKSFIDFISSFYKDLLTPLFSGDFNSAVAGFGSMLVKGIDNVTSLIFNTIRSIDISKIVEDFAGRLTQFADSIFTALRQLANTAFSALSGIRDFVSSLVSEIARILNEIGSSLLSSINRVFRLDDLAQGMSDFISGIWDKVIIPAFSGNANLALINAESIAIEIFNGVSNSITSVDAVSLLSDVSTFIAESLSTVIQEGVGLVGAVFNLDVSGVWNSIQMNLDDLAAEYGSGIPGFDRVVSSIANALAVGIKGIMGTALAGLGEVLNFDTTTIANSIYTAIDSLVTSITTAFSQKTIESFVSGVNKLVNAIIRLFNGAKEVLMSGSGTLLKDSINAIASVILTFPFTLINYIVDAFTSFSEALAELTQADWDSIARSVGLLGSAFALANFGKLATIAWGVIVAGVQALINSVVGKLAGLAAAVVIIKSVADNLDSFLDVLRKIGEGDFGGAIETLVSSLLDTFKAIGVNALKLLGFEDVAKQGEESFKKLQAMAGIMFEQMGIHARNFVKSITEGLDRIINVTLPLMAAEFRLLAYQIASSFSLDETAKKNARETDLYRGYIAQVRSATEYYDFNKIGTQGGFSMAAQEGRFAQAFDTQIAGMNDTQILAAESLGLAIRSNMGNFVKFMIKDIEWLAGTSGGQDSVAASMSEYVKGLDLSGNLQYALTDIARSGNFNFLGEFIQASLVNVEHLDPSMFADVAADVVDNFFMSGNFSEAKITETLTALETLSNAYEQAILRVEGIDSNSPGAMALLNQAMELDGGGDKIAGQVERLTNNVNYLRDAAAGVATTVDDVVVSMEAAEERVASAGAALAATGAAATSSMSLMLNNSSNINEGEWPSNFSPNPASLVSVPITVDPVVTEVSPIAEEAAASIQNAMAESPPETLVEIEVPAQATLDILGVDQLTPKAITDLSDVLTQLSLSLTGVHTTITTLVQPTIAELSLSIETLVNVGILNFATAATNAATTLTTIVNPAVDQVKESFNSMSLFTLPVLNGMLMLTSGLLTMTFPGGAAAAAKAVKLIEDAFFSLGNTVTRVTNLLLYVAEASAKAASEAASAAGSIADAAVSSANAAVKGNGGGGKSVEGRASGGTVKKGMYRINEHGSEVLIERGKMYLLSSGYGKVEPLSKGLLPYFDPTAKTMGGGIYATAGQQPISNNAYSYSTYNEGDIVVNVTVDSASSSKEISNRVTEAIRKQKSDPVSAKKNFRSNQQ